MEFRYIKFDKNGKMCGLSTDSSKVNTEGFEPIPDDLIDKVEYLKRIQTGTTTVTQTDENGEEITVEQPVYEIVVDEEAVAADEERKAKAQIQAQIDALKRNLADTDYQAIKYAEGELSAEDYAEMKAQRVAWRAEINELESQLSE